MKNWFLKLFTHLHSKKFTFALLAVSISIFIYFINLYVIYKKPEIGASVLGMFNVIMSLIGAISGTLISGQSFVDWKHGSVSQAVVTHATEKIEQVIERKSIKSNHFEDEDTLRDL